MASSRDNHPVYRFRSDPSRLIALGYQQQDALRNIGIQQQAILQLLSHYEHNSRLGIADMTTTINDLFSFHSQSTSNFDPTFSAVREQEDASEAQASRFLSAIARAPRLLRYFIRQATERQCRSNFRELIDEAKQLYLERNRTMCSSEVDQLYELFTTNKSKSTAADALLRLYTLINPPLFETLRKNCGSYTALVYLHLNEMQHRAYKGISYRGAPLTPIDFDHFESACLNQTIIQTRTFLSTSQDKAVAEMFVDQPGQFVGFIIFDFSSEDGDNGKACPTAMNLTKEPVVAKLESEQEVLIFPFTLFTVTSIVQDPISRRYTIKLKNVKVLKRSLQSFIWERTHWK
jgi:hypothetical protein